MNNQLEQRSDNDVEVLNISKVRSEVFNATFSRYYRVLYLVAYRVLFSHGDAEQAMQNFFFSASNNVPQFECEGSFRSWLLRGLIDEALAILHNNKSRPRLCSGSILDPISLLPPLDSTCEETPAPSV